MAKPAVGQSAVGQGLAATRTVYIAVRAGDVVADAGRLLRQPRWRPAPLAHLGVLADLAVRPGAGALVGGSGLRLRVTLIHLLQPVGLPARWGDAGVGAERAGCGQADLWSVACPHNTGDVRPSGGVVSRAAGRAVGGVGRGDRVSLCALFIGERVSARSDGGGAGARDCAVGAVGRAAVSASAGSGEPSSLGVECWNAGFDPQPYRAYVRFAGCSAGPGLAGGQ